MLNKLFEQLADAIELADFCRSTHDMQMCGFYNGKAYALYNVLKMYGLSDDTIAHKVLQSTK